MNLPPPLAAVPAPTGYSIEDVPTTAFWCGMRVPNTGVSPEVPHVNNAEYVRWVDRAAELAVDSVGHTRQAMLAVNRMWFVVRHELDYRAECFVDEDVLVATWVHSHTQTTSLRETRIVRTHDGKPILTATTRWAYINLETRRPARIPRELLSLVYANDGAS